MRCPIKSVSHISYSNPMTPRPVASISGRSSIVNFLNTSLTILSGLHHENLLSLDWHFKLCMCLLWFLTFWPKINNDLHQRFSDNFIGFTESFFDITKLLKFYLNRCNPILSWPDNFYQPIQTVSVYQCVHTGSIQIYNSI